MKTTGPTNLQTQKVIAALEKAGRKRKQKIWLDVARLLAKPRRARASVNVWKLSRLAKKFRGKIFLVPGKILGQGAVEGKITAAALEFSGSAKKALAEKGEALTLPELLEKKIEPKEIMIVK